MSLTLGEEHGLWIFEKRVLNRIFVPKRDEITGGSRTFNEELHNWVACMISLHDTTLLPQYQMSVLNTEQVTSCQNRI